MLLNMIKKYENLLRSFLKKCDLILIHVYNLYNKHGLYAIE
jgi:hypothetical protein